MSSGEPSVKRRRGGAASIDTDATFLSTPRRKNPQGGDSESVNAKTLGKEVGRMSLEVTGALAGDMLCSANSGGDYGSWSVEIVSGQVPPRRKFMTYLLDPQNYTDPIVRQYFRQMHVLRPQWFEHLDEDDYVGRAQRIRDHFPPAEWCSPSKFSALGDGAVYVSIKTCAGKMEEALSEAQLINVTCTPKQVETVLMHQLSLKSVVTWCLNLWRVDRSVNVVGDILEYPHPGHTCIVLNTGDLTTVGNAFEEHGHLPTTMYILRMSSESSAQPVRIVVVHDHDYDDDDDDDDEMAQLHAYVGEKLGAFVAKSLLQKLIRFSPSFLEFGEQQPIMMDAEKAVRCVGRWIATHPGQYQPRIQRYVRGIESFCKRAAVCAMEDSYLPPRQILSLMTGAFLANRVSRWKPSVSQVNKWIRWCSDMVREDRVYPWRVHLTDDPAHDPSYHWPNVQTPLEAVSCLLTAIRSFDGDIRMSKLIAKYDMCGVLHKDCVPRDEHDVMRVEHAIDHHCASSIAYLAANEPEGAQLVQKTGTPFAKVFETIFQKSSALNRRVGIHEPAPEWIANVQRRYMQRTNFATIPVHRFAPPNSVKHTFSFHLDDSWLAAMVGTCYEEDEWFAVILDHLQLPATKIVPLKPEPKYKAPADQRTVVQRVLRRGLALHATRDFCPLPTIDTLRHNVSLDDAGELSINGIPWSRHRSCVLDVPIYGTIDDRIKDMNYALSHKPPPGTQILLLAGTSTVDETLSVLLSSPQLCHRRLLWFIDQYKRVKTFRMCPVDLSGGTSAASATGIVFVEDAQVYGFFVRMSLCFPGAIRRSRDEIDRFEVVDTCMWYALCMDMCRIILATSNTVENDDDGGGGGAAAASASMGGGWSRAEFRVAHAQGLKPIQQRVLEQLKDDEAHCSPNRFVFMPTGDGKTLVAYQYLRHLRDRSELPPYVIFTTPHSAMEAVEVQAATSGLPVNVINFTLKRRDVNKLFLPFHINLIEHDHLRLLADKLYAIVRDAVVVFDEVHLMQRTSIRSGVAQNLASNCSRFLAMTGTPVIDGDRSRLGRWLERIVSFPVTADNFYVACSVAITSDSEREPHVIEVVDTSVRVSMRADELADFGHALNAGTRHQFQICYNTIYRAMCDYVRAHLAQHRCFFLVVCTKADITRVAAMLSGIVDPASVYADPDRAPHLPATSDESRRYRVIIHDMARNSGYDATRATCMLTATYPSNVAGRVQMRGRINRRHTQDVGVVQYVEFQLAQLDDLRRRHALGTRDHEAVTRM